MTGQRQLRSRAPILPDMGGLSIAVARCHPMAVHRVTTLSGGTDLCGDGGRVDVVVDINRFLVAEPDAPADESDGNDHHSYGAS